MTLGRIQGSSGAHHSPIATSMVASDMLETHFQRSVKFKWSRSGLEHAGHASTREAGGWYKCGVGDSGRRGSTNEVPGPEGGNICSPKLAFWTHLQLRGAPEQERLTRLLQHKRGSHDCLHRIQSYRGPLPFSVSLSDQPQCSSPHASAAFPSFRMAIAQAPCLFSFLNFGNRWSCVTLSQSE
jgi:hypothetical protein